MKNLNLLIIFGLCLFIFSCNNDKNTSKEQELKDKEKELELKSKELELKKQEKELNDEENKLTGKNTQKEEELSKGELDKDDLSSFNAMINGTSVIMRTSYSVQSSKITSFTNGEKLRIIDNWTTENENEAIALTPIRLYDKDGNYTISIGKGKALVLENSGRATSDGTYEVAFEHTKYGKLFATVNKSDIQIITSEKWYKVQRQNGQMGWVLGKFVKKM